jgi:hypothetical protein
MAMLSWDDIFNMDETMWTVSACLWYMWAWAWVWCEAEGVLVMPDGNTSQSFTKV